MKNNVILKKSLFIFLMIAGFIFARHYISARESTKEIINLEKYETSQQELQELEKERNNLEEEYQKLNSELYELWYEVIDADDFQELDLLESLENSKLIAGITDVIGNGVVVTINDKEGYDPLDDHIASLIHDQNIIYLIDLLINNGAQAISINDLRIINSSNIFCVGTTILCNNQRMAPPYIIKAIGPQEKMVEALKKDPLYTELQSDPYLIRFKIELTNNILIKGYATPATIDKDISFLNNIAKEAIQNNTIN